MLFLGALLALGMITATGIYSGRQIKNAADFSGGSANSGTIIVTGTIIGTLVGGSATIGTAQLAYTYGISAWWFTLGAGIACLFLAIGFVDPFRNSGCKTMQEMIGREYGTGARLLSSILTSIGTFISIIPQLISGGAVVAILLPSLNPLLCSAIVAVLMLFYVVFGGVWGTGLVGMVKTCLLYLTVVVSGILACHLAGGFGTILTELDPSRYFNLFARGFSVDAGAGLSLIFGVLSTQTYAQASLAGRTNRIAKKGALISAVMTPPIGVGGILVGMYMRISDASALAAGTLDASAAAKTALPRFVMGHLPPFVSGVVLATLLITVLGTGAGLALGISTILHRDVVSRVTNRFSGARSGLIFSRCCIAAVILVALMFTMLPNDLILDFSFLSMGLRAAVVFCPLVGALFFPGRIERKFAVAAIIGGPLFVFIGKMIHVSFDPLFLGMAAALISMAVGLMVGPKKAE